jgi:hypothetical protein
MVIVFDHDVYLATVDSPSLVQLVGRHHDAVVGRAAEVESWTTQIAEITDPDRAAIDFFFYPGWSCTGEREGHQDDGGRKKCFSQVVSRPLSLGETRN